MYTTNTLTDTIRIHLLKRVQILLEPWQHEWLINTAKQQNESISGLLRTLLTGAIERYQLEDLTDDPLWGIIGLGEAPDDGITSENLDDFLYGPQPAQPILRIAKNDDTPDYR